jgi:hypothetical protein
VDSVFGWMALCACFLFFNARNCYSSCPGVLMDWFSRDVWFNLGCC